MSSHITTFSKSAKDLSKNPLGIISLFIVMVYGFACLLFGISAEALQSNEKIPLIWFVVIFPVIVLILFGWLVSKHHNKLYAPQDFRDDKAFLDSYKQQASNPNVVNDMEKSQQNIEDIMASGNEFQLVKEQEIIIRSDLTQRKVEHEGTAADVLIRSLAIAQVNTWFEKVYHTLFGSQVALLRKISDFEKGMPYKNVERHFTEAQNTYPDQLGMYTLEQYLNYLFQLLIIQKSGNNLILTSKGHDFLGILSASNYPERSC